MKKSMIFVGMLCIGYANAQTTDSYEGRVGINTEEPSATLEVKSKGNTNATNALSIKNSDSSTSVRVTDDNKVYIGFSDTYTSNGSESLEVLNTRPDTQATFKTDAYGIWANRYSKDINPVSIVLTKGRGNFTTPEFIQSGDALGRINFRPNYINTTPVARSRDGAFITVHVPEVIDETKYSTRMYFATRSSTEQGARYNMILSEKGYLGIGLPDAPSERLEINGNIKVLGFKGTGNRNVYADKNGVLQVGDVVETIGATTLTGEENLVCNDTNRGKMNFVKDVTIGSGTGDAFAVCLKGTDGKFYWRYLYGASGVTNAQGNFGAGLQ